MKWLSPVMFFIAMAGCIQLPEAPDREMFSSVDSLSPGHVKHYVYKSTHARTWAKTSPKKTKNLLLVVADSFIQKDLRDKAEKHIGRSFSEDIDLEKLSWWHYSPLFEDIYNEVYLVKRDGARYLIIQDIVERLEQKNVPYDIIFLTHGLPNHISSGEDYFLSWREIAHWQGKLKYLNLVFMQGCFGNTLEKDWMRTGAKAVISYEGFNRNFFYLSSFLKWYRWMPDDIASAYVNANANLEFNLKNSLFYSTIITRILGLTVNEYLESSEMPLLFQN